MKIIGENALKLVNEFFSQITKQPNIAFPPVLKNSGRWLASCEDSILGIFYIDNEEFKRATQYQNDGWPIFPGFLISEDKLPPGSPVAVAISGSCNLFSSNRTSNMFAFCVKPSASFTVVDHFQEIRDVSGQEFKYKVDLAFVIGISNGETWESVKKRLEELLEHSVNVWRNSI
jgi:hypothetical protein